MAESVTARLSEVDVRVIDSLVEAGLYSTRSDFLRAAARHLLREEAPEVPPVLLELQRESRSKKIVLSGLMRKARSLRRRSHGETFGDG